MSKEDAPNFRVTLAKTCYTCRHFDSGMCNTFDIDFDDIDYDTRVCDNHSLKEVICPTCQGRGKICPK